MGTVEITQDEHGIFIHDVGRPEATLQYWRDGKLTQYAFETMEAAQAEVVEIEQERNKILAEMEAERRYEENQAFERYVHAYNFRRR